jgi:hypothetical protein
MSCKEETCLWMRVSSRRPRILLPLDASTAQQTHTQQTPLLHSQASKRPEGLTENVRRQFSFCSLRLKRISPMRISFYSFYEATNKLLFLIDVAPSNGSQLNPIQRLPPFSLNVKD